MNRADFENCELASPQIALGALGKNRELRIRGSLPALSSLAGTVVEVRVDGEPILKRRIARGDFDLRAQCCRLRAHTIEDARRPCRPPAVSRRTRRAAAVALGRVRSAG